jgi:hypothetical protein
MTSPASRKRGLFAERLQPSAAGISLSSHRERTERSPDVAL